MLSGGGAQKLGIGVEQEVDLGLDVGVDGGGPGAEADGEGKIGDSGSLRLVDGVGIRHCNQILSIRC